MLLSAILSLDLVNLALPRVADCVLKLRLVSREIMSALESNPWLIFNIRIKDTGVDNFDADFLQRWHGNICLHCKHPCNLGSRWFKEVSDALLSDRLRPLSLLSLSVEGGNLHPVVKTLAAIGPAIQQLEIAYSGNGAELLASAAPIASLGHALTMIISVQGSDPGGRQTSLWLHHLLESSIRISCISFRSVRLLSLPR
jgi:hypothetical protein